MIRGLVLTTLVCALVGNACACRRTGSNDARTNDRGVEVPANSTKQQPAKGKKPNASEPAESLATMNGAQLWEAKIKVFDDLTLAIESDAPQQTFDYLAQRMVSIAKHEKKLNLPVDQQIELEAKYMPIMREANRRQTAALAKNPTEKFTRMWAREPKTPKVAPNPK